MRQFSITEIWRFFCCHSSGNNSVVYWCRSPPPFDLPVNHLWIEWRASPRRGCYHYKKWTFRVSIWVWQRIQLRNFNSYFKRYHIDSSRRFYEGSCGFSQRRCLSLEIQSAVHGVFITNEPLMSVNTYRKKLSIYERKKAERDGKAPIYQQRVWWYSYIRVE